MATTEQLPPGPGLPGDGDEKQEREVARKLAERYRFAFIDLREQRIDAELFRTIPADLMFRYNFVPLELQNNVLAIAAADPGQVQMSDELPLLLGKKLLIRVATARQIGDILKRTEQSQRVLEQATEAFTLQTSKEEEESDETISGDRLTRDSTASPVVRLVETIIFTALERRASDIHIEARDSEVAVKYRIDGVLQHAMQPIAKEWHSTVLSRIKVLSELDIAERRVPQDGRFRVKYKGRYIDLRVSIMPASHGEDAVLRVLDKETLSEKFSSLTLDVVGFSVEETRRFRRYIREPYGMVLVTGPTGSGKTTTLYAAINEIKTDEDKIVTIEDPVEYQLRGITQIPVNEKKGLTFARGLRSILRHDPDKIMVGEIRDQEKIFSRGIEGSRPRSGCLGKRNVCRGRRLPGMFGYWLSWPDGDLRIARPDRPHPGNDCGSPSDFGDQAHRLRRGHDHSARKRGGQDSCGHHDRERDQQG